VTLNKVSPDAIDETKIQDNSISTPKLQAGSIVSDKIASRTIRAENILAGEVTAFEIRSDTITANQIDVLDLNTDDLEIGSDTDSQWRFNSFQDQTLGISWVEMYPNSVDPTGYIGTSTNQFRRMHSLYANFEGITLSDYGGSGREIVPSTDDTGQVGDNFNAFSLVYAYSYVDATDGSTIADGGSALEGLSSMSTVPDHCQECDDDGNTVGTRINDLSKWLFSVCREQQQRMEDLEERVAALEEAHNT